MTEQFHDLLRDAAASEAASAASPDVAPAAVPAAPPDDAAPDDAAPAVAPDAMPPEILAANLLKKLDDNPGMRPAARAILDECREQPQEEEALLGRVHAQLAEARELPVQPISAVLAMLVREGAIDEHLEVDGAPYAGTLEDAFEDESIPADAAALIYASTTSAGEIVLAEEAPDSRVRALFADKPQHVAAFRRVLALCDVEGGLSTDELGRALDAEGFLHRDERTGVPGIYPSMYANLLKDVGCLEWERAWKTTEAGRRVPLA